ncbi:Mitochondrial distribution and morphology protein 12 [Linnemannia zychae]|nr:Mitochondrial distribution and morphology protein 12 [Linnemannia zychae]
MSFVFEWDKLDDEVALQIEGMIHAHFQRIPKPTFMGNIAVSKFRFGSTPPSITVLDVTDPLEEWYVHMDQEEARLAQEAAEGGGGESMDEDELASEDEYDDEYSYSGDGSIVMVGEGDDIEYLRSGSYEEDEQLETEEWMRRHNHRSQRQEGSSSDHEYYSSTRDNNQHFKSAMASPTRISPSSSTSSSASGQSRRPSVNDHSLQAGNRYYGDSRESKAPSATSIRNNQNPKLGIDTSLTSPGRERSSFATKKPVTTHSLSSHASDDEIESEAFYTQGESTIYQRMKNLVLEPSSFLSSRPASVEGEALDEEPLPQSSTTQQPILGAPLFSSTPGGLNGNANNGLGFGFNAGIGSSPGSVLSSVMQTRSATRPLSAASFYTKMLMGYLRDHVNVSFLEPEDPNERIESQVGDEQKQAVLKNVGKIERFVVEQLRKFITEDFVYPSYHSIELQRPPAPAPPSQPGDAGGSAKNLTAVGSIGRNQSSRGVSPAPSTNAESLIHEPYRQGGTDRGIGGHRGGRGGALGSRGSAGSATTTASVGGDASSLRARPRAASTYSRH